MSTCARCDAARLFLPCTDLPKQLAVLMLQGNLITSIHPNWFLGLPANLPPLLSPNPLVCNYTVCPGATCATPVDERLTCNTCSLGYAFDANTSACTTPPFGPAPGWDASQQRSDFGTGKPLHRGGSYSAEAPELAPNLPPA